MNTEKEICFYSISTHQGGAERSLLELLIGLKERSGLGYSFFVLLPKSTGPLIDELKKHKIDYEVLEMPKGLLEVSRSRPLLSFLKISLYSPLFGVYLIKLTRLLKKRKPALIHTTGIKCHLIGALIGRKISVPVLWHLRDILKSGPTLYLLEGVRRLFKPRCIANSQATANSFSNKPTPIDVIYNGISPDSYFPKPNRHYNELLGLRNDVPIIGIVGVLAKWKGQIQFLKMAKKLIKNKREVFFVIIGDTIYDTHGERNFKDDLVKKAKKLGLEKKVHFAGFQKNPALAISGLNILVHASIKPEPFGRVILEAFACQVPAVASKGGGVSELVKENQTGLLFEPGNVNEMVKQVESLLSESDLGPRLSKNAYQYFLDNFTQSHHVENMVRYYKSIEGLSLKND